MNEKFSDERISAFLDDELSAEDRALIERELAENADLRQAVEELRALRTGLQALPRHRLETNIAERVLQLAEREVLVGSRAADQAGGLPAGAVTSGNGAGPGARGGEPARLQASAPSYSVAPPSHTSDNSSVHSSVHTSAHGGRFSWRTLACSAAAAAAAVLITNYYHRNIAPDAGGGGVAVAEKNGDQSEHATRGAVPGDREARGRPAGEMAQGAAAPDAGLDSAAAQSRSNALTKQDGEGDDLVNNALVDDAAIGDRAGEGLMAKDDSIGRKVGGGLYGQGFGSPQGSGDVSRGGGDGNGDHANGDHGDGGDDAGVSFVVVDVSPQAWQDRAFDKLLLANRVMLLDDSMLEDSTNRAADGAATRSRTGGAGRSQPRSDPRSDDAAAENQRKETDEGKGSGAGGQLAASLPPRSDMVVVDITQEQLSELLAAVDQRSDAFTRAEQFSLAEAEEEVAEARNLAKKMQGPLGRDELVEDGSDSPVPTPPPAAEALSPGKGALEMTDPGEKLDKSSVRGSQGSRGSRGSGNPPPQADRAEKTSPANDAPAAPSEENIAEEKSEPPHDAQSQGDSKRTTEKKAEGFAGASRSRSANPSVQPSGPTSENAPAVGSAEKPDSVKSPEDRAVDGSRGKDKPAAKSLGRGGARNAEPPAPSSVDAPDPVEAPSPAEAPSPIEPNVPPRPAPSEVSPSAKPQNAPTEDAAGQRPEPESAAARENFGAAGADSAGSAADRTKGESPAEHAERALPPAGFARRVPPKSDVGDRELAGGRDSSGGRRGRAGAAEPSAPAEFGVPADAAPEAPKSKAPGAAAPKSEMPSSEAAALPPDAAASDAPRSATLDKEPPVRGRSSIAGGDETAARRSTAASPRVRVIFLLRKAQQAPSALELAAPAEAAPATPAPSVPAPAAESRPVEAAPLPASPP
jgi:hypothetical protein